MGRFHVIDVIAVGGMGTVYSAHDPELHRTVALKVLPVAGGDDATRACWHREAQAMARVSHRNVVEFLEVGTDEDCVYIAMELVAGGDLRRVLQRRKLSVSETLELFAGIAQGLQAVHDAGLLHCDFKPQNVLIGPGTRPLLTDFGLARPRASRGGGDAAGDEPDTPAGRVVGTPRFMSPEQIEGKPLTAASDQFSFGVALYEALFSRHPFVHVDTQSLHAEVLGGEPVPPAARGVPKRVRGAVLRCLRKDPADRFGSMREVAELLEGALVPTSFMATVAICAAATGLAIAWVAGSG